MPTDMLSPIVGLLVTTSTSMPGGQDDELDLGTLDVNVDDQALGVRQEQEIVEENTHAINIATAYLLLTIFSFFTFLVTVVLIMHYCERKRLGFSREILILPTGPVPSYMTVSSTNDAGNPQCHGHYQFHPVLTQVAGQPSPHEGYGSFNQMAAPCHMCDTGKKPENVPMLQQSFAKDPTGQ